MPESITRTGMRTAPAMKAPSCLGLSRLSSWRVTDRSGRLGTCCERVAARDKKKEGEDIVGDRGGGTISCRVNDRLISLPRLYNDVCGNSPLHVITVACSARKRAIH